MADRTVRVTLSAQVAAYKQGMQEAATATRTVGKEGEKLAQTRQAFDGIGRAGLAMGTLIGAGMTVAVARFAEFDAAMSKVDAATGETAANMDLLRQAAIDAGSSTVFSATEAAGAIEELAKAGVSTADILGGALKGSLDLAAAGQLDVARAAEITSTALNQFGLEGSDASHVADVLAAGAGKAMGSVDDLAQGLKFVGPVAASMGVSLEETTGALALFAQQGIIGEQAGTSLRGVLSSLTSPSSQARDEIKKLGITLYDSKGNFLGLENAAGQLSKAYGEMDGASRDASLGIIFGRETVTAATALYQAGAGGVAEWTEAVDDSGYAAEQARKRLDNLKGDLEALQGAMDTALIQTGSGANDALRGLVQTISGLVGIFNDLDPAAQEAFLAIGGGVGAVTLAGGAAFLAVPKWLEMKAAIEGSGNSMAGIGLKAAGAGIALAGLFAIVGELASRYAESQAKAQQYATTLEGTTNQVTEATRRLAKENLATRDSFFWLESDSTYDAAEKLGISIDLVTDAATGNAEALKTLQKELGGAQYGTNEFQDKLDASGLSLTDYMNAISDVTNGVSGETGAIEDSIRVAEQKQRADTESAASSELAAEGAKSAAAAYVEASSGAAQLESDLRALIDTINESNGVGQDAVSSNIAYNDAIAKVDETIRRATEGEEGYAITLDQTTQAGRDNLGMLNDLAGKSQAAAEAQFALDGNTENYRATLEAGRQAVIDRATALGMNADQAGRLADQIYRIPTEREITVIADTRDAEAALSRITAEREVNVYARVIGGSVADRVDRATRNANGNLWDYQGTESFAGGGFPTGIYAGRRGSIHKFAEPETVWEAYISGKPDQRDRNVGIAFDALDRLGVRAPAQSAPPQITNNIYPQPGMSEETIGAAAAKKMNFELRGA